MTFAGGVSDVSNVGIVRVASGVVTFLLLLTLAYPTVAVSAQPVIPTTARTVGAIPTTAHVGNRAIYRMVLAGTARSSSVSKKRICVDSRQRRISCPKSGKKARKTSTTRSSHLSAGRSAVSAGRAATLSQAANFEDVKIPSGVLEDLAIAGSLGLVAVKRRRQRAEVALGHSSLPIFARRLLGASRRAAPVSPLVTKLFTNASYLRILAGPAELMVPVAGVVLGIVATVSVHGSASLPSALLFILIASLGIIDALAGALAWLPFALTALLTGHLAHLNELTAVVFVGGLWFGVSPMLLIIRSVRPLGEERSEYWHLSGNIVIAGLLSYFLVAKLSDAAVMLTGSGADLTQHGTVAGVIVGAVAVLRYVVSFVVAQRRPDDFLAWTEVKVPAQLRPALWIAKSTEVAIVFGLVAHVLHLSAMTILLVLLYAIEQSAPFFMSKYHLSPLAHRLVPRDGGKILVLSLAIGVFTIWARHITDDPLLQASHILVRLMAMGLVLTGLSSMRGTSTPLSPLVRRSGGVLIVVVTILQLGGYLIH